jgi:site-specific recombinase XerD
MTSDDVRRYRVHLDKKGLKPATVMHLLSDLRALLNWAEDSGHIERSGRRSAIAQDVARLGGPG